MDCPVCRGAAAPAFRAAHVQVAKCGAPACGHLFAVDPAPHQGVEDHTDFDGPMAQFGARNERLIALFTRRGALPPNARVLDFGAGVGHILRSLKAARPDIDITFIEANPDVAARVAGFGFAEAKRLEDATGPYDLIIAVEVIEHVDDPVGLLSAFRERLAPHGQLFYTTPCGEDRRGRHDNPAAFEDPAHIHFFTEASMREACRAAGLEVTIEALSEVSPPDRFPVEQLKSAARWVRDTVIGYRQLRGFAQNRNAAAATTIETVRKVA